MLRLSYAAPLLLLSAAAQAAPGDACLRAAHLSPDAPNVDIFITPPGAAPVTLSDVPFTTISGYSALPPVTYQIVVAAAGDANAVVLDFPVATSADAAQTVAVVGTLGGDSLEPLLLADDPTLADPGQSRVRFVHASPDAPTVDITLTDGTTLFDDVSFKTAAGYISVAAGSYDLQVRDASGSSVVLELPGVTLLEGQAYSVFATGLLAGDPALGATIAVDAPNDCSPRDLQGVYSDPAQNGQGVQLIQTGDAIEGVWYVYDGAGMATFYTFAGSFENGSLNSDLVLWSGPALGTSWDESQVQSETVGSVTLTLSDETRGDVRFSDRRR